MNYLEPITIVNLSLDKEWVKDAKNGRFRIIQTPDRRWRRGILFVRAEHYMGPQPDTRDRLIEMTANLSAFIAGVTLSKPVYYSTLRLIELIR